MTDTPESRLLVLGHSGRGIDFTTVYETLAQNENVDIRVFDQSELKHLKRLLRQIDTSRYSYVLADLPFKRAYRAAKEMGRMPGLTLYEEDAYQNFIENTRWRGYFSDYYRKLPNAQVVFTGHYTARQFQQIGVNAHCIPKGFDPSMIYPTFVERDIQAAFIGRTRSQVYQGRAAFLEKLQQTQGVQLLRTSNLDEYRETLNRIRIFVSADIGLTEYMAKNYEAMACGCTVLARRQGHQEEESLGFKDMTNIVLYENYDEAVEKLAILRNDEALCDRIGNAGRQLVTEHYSHIHIANKLLNISRQAKEIAANPGKKRWWLF